MSEKLCNIPAAMIFLLLKQNAKATSSVNNIRTDGEEYDNYRCVSSLTFTPHSSQASCKSLGVSDCMAMSFNALIDLFTLHLTSIMYHISK